MSMSMTMMIMITNLFHESFSLVNFEIEQKLIEFAQFHCSAVDHSNQTAQELIKSWKQ